MQNHISIAGRENDKRGYSQFARSKQKREFHLNHCVGYSYYRRIHVLLWANEMGAKERYQEYKYDNKYYMYLE